MGYQGSITFIQGVRRKRVPLYYVASLSALQTFAQQVEAYTAGGVGRMAVTEVVTMTPQAPRESKYVGYYAVFRFINPDPDEGENPRREFHLADPLESLFELVDEKLVIKTATGEQFAAWYSAVTDKTYEFDKGWLWQG